MNAIINNQVVSYRRCGAGPVIVLLHGWSSNKENFHDLIENLSANHEVIALDFPGFGESPAPSYAWGVREYAQLVADFLSHQKIATVYAMIGHSFGGRVIIKGVATGIFRPSKVILVGSAGVRHSHSLRNLLFLVVAKAGKILLSPPFLQRYARKAKQSLYGAAGSEDYLVSQGVMKDIFTKVIGEDLRQDAAKNTLPTLLIWGSEDHEAPLADARYFQQVMAHAEIKIVQGAGHFVHHDAPRKVGKWISSFIAASK